MSLESLRKQCPWPDAQPSREVQWHGWMAPGTHEALTNLCPRSAKLIVECGSWAGLSAKFFLERAPEATLICIDHWCQFPEQIAPLSPPPEAVPLIPVIYDMFVANHWDNRRRIIPVRMDSLEGLRLVLSEQLNPDVLYLDSDHSTIHLLEELRLAARFPYTRVVGDDYTHKSVQDAIAIHTKESGWLYDHNTEAFWRA